MQHTARSHDTLIQATKQRSRGFLSLSNATSADGLVRSGRKTTAWARDETPIVVETSEVGAGLHGYSGSRNAMRVTPRQQQVVDLLREEGGFISASDRERLDGRVLRNLFTLGLIREFDGGIALTEMADLLSGEEESSSSSSFRDRAAAALGGYGWQARLARATGVSRQTIVKWASGRLDVPEYILALLECLEAMKKTGTPFPERFR